MTSTLELVIDVIDSKGRHDMRTEDDKRLTPAQQEIRDRCGNVPKRIRRSIDAYRVARGMVPLWTACLPVGGRPPSSSAR